MYIGSAGETYTETAVGARYSDQTLKIIADTLGVRIVELVKGL
jgi:hypothetical protein